MIILDDVDMDYAVRTATFGSFFHQGQICLNTRRIIVQRKIADEFTQKIGALVRVSVRRIKITMALGCLAAAVWGAAAVRLNAAASAHGARRIGIASFCLLPQSYQPNVWAHRQKSSHANVLRC
jgi:acyl-CoA reductase-like NAD-dependent aldehyde dehydrogenase